MRPLQPNADPNPYASPLLSEGWRLPPSVPFDDYCNQRQGIHILWALATFTGVPLAATAIALHLQFWNGRWTDPRGCAVLLVAVAGTVAAQLVLANFIYAYGPDVGEVLRFLGIVEVVVPFTRAVAPLRESPAVCTDTGAAMVRAARHDRQGRVLSVPRGIVQQGSQASARKLAPCG
jgi:hypothetical protein